MQRLFIADSACIQWYFTLLHYVTALLRTCTVVDVEKATSTKIDLPRIIANLRGVFVRYF